MPTTMTTTIEDNKALVRRFIDEIFLQGKPDAVEELLADDFVPHNWGKTGTGKTRHDGRDQAGVGRPVGRAHDHRGRDRRGGQGGGAADVARGPDRPVHGPPAERQAVHDRGDPHLPDPDGKVTEHWHQGDFMGMLTQLGAMPGQTPEPSRPGSGAHA